MSAYVDDNTSDETAWDSYPRKELSMRWDIEGAKRDNGEEINIFLEADSKVAALRMANERGIVVSVIRSMPSTLPPTEADNERKRASMLVDIPLPEPVQQQQLRPSTPTPIVAQKWEYRMVQIPPRINIGEQVEKGNEAAGFLQCTANTMAEKGVGVALSHSFAFVRIMRL